MNGAPMLSSAELRELSPFDIDEGERIGFLHQDKAVAMGRLLAVDGQRDPIKICANPGNAEKPWKLVTGMHRLIGARLEEINVFAIVVSGKPESLVDLEASENLHRRPLLPIERAKFTAALVHAAQERIAREHGNLSSQQLGIRKRWDKVRSGELRAEQALRDEGDDTYATMAQVYGWEESVGEALGMSRRTIHRDLELYRLIIEPFSELSEPLSNHPVVGENASQLKAIAAVKDEVQRRAVIELLLGDPEMGAELARAKIGIDRPGGPAPTPTQKIVNAVVGNLARLSATAQKHNLDGIVLALKSDDVRRQLRDRLNEELGDG
ncbi:MAG: hypothetical protein KUG65_05935 [Sphingomonadaceae bacterium]|nr:hypothetical protein [Sphingomonadaceae bacterium]